MSNCTLSTTLDDFDAYAIEMDNTCVTQDYEVADMQTKELENITISETDIQFE